MFKTSTEVEPDPVIEVYKKNIDRPLIPAENLRLTAEDRFEIWVVTNFIDWFSLAQAFTPGRETEGVLKAPLMGLLGLNALLLPGVNAWATEKLFQIGDLPEIWSGCKVCRRTTILMRYLDQSISSQPVPTINHQHSAVEIVRRV